MLFLNAIDRFSALFIFQSFIRVFINARAELIVWLNRWGCRIIILNILRILLKVRELLILCLIGHLFDLLIANAILIIIILCLLNILNFNQLAMFWSLSYAFERIDSLTLCFYKDNISRLLLEWLPQYFHPIQIKFILRVRKVYD